MAGGLLQQHGLAGPVLTMSLHRHLCAGSFSFSETVAVVHTIKETVRIQNDLHAQAGKYGGEPCLKAVELFNRICHLIMETQYEKVLKKVSSFAQEQNEKITAPQGLFLVGLVS